MVTTALLIAIIAIIILAIGAWLAYKFYKKKQIEKITLSNVPIDVLNDFEKAEKMLARSIGNKNPYTILYEIAKGHLEEVKEETERRDMINGQSDTSKEAGAGINAYSRTEGSDDKPISSAMDTESAVREDAMDRKPEGRQDIQNGSSGDYGKYWRDFSPNEQNNQGNKRSFFGKLFRWKN